MVNLLAPQGQVIAGFGRMKVSARQSSLQLGSAFLAPGAVDSDRMGNSCASSQFLD